MKNTLSIAAIALLAALSLPLSATQQAADPASRIVSLAASNDWTGVANTAADWARQKPLDPMAHYWLGVALWQDDDKTGGIRALRTAQRLGLDAAFLHKSLGLAYYSINQFVLFRRQMEKATALDPNDPQPHFHIGRYFESVRQDYAQALQHFNKALASDPSHAKSLAYRAYCLEMMGSSDQAREGYQRAVKSLEAKGEKFSWPYYRLAGMMLSANDPQQALLWARRAVAVEPDAALNHYVLAKIHLAMNDAHEALPEAQAAVQFDPKSTAARYLLSRVYAMLGRAEAARAERDLFNRLKVAYGTE